MGTKVAEKSPGPRHGPRTARRPAASGAAGSRQPPPASAPADPATDSGAAYDSLKARGNLFVKQKKFSEAITCYTHCIELDSSAPAAFNNRALCHLSGR